MTKDFLQLYDSLMCLLLNDALSRNRNENVVCSPLSVFILLEMLSISSGGRTREEIDSAFAEHIEPKRLMSELSGFVETLGHEEVLHAANVVFASEVYEGSLKPEFRKQIEDGFCTGFVKPYEDEFDFMALLPRKTFPEQLPANLKLSELYRNMTDEAVNAYMPEFRTEYSRELMGFFQSIGIRDAFVPDADFSNMTDLPVMISSVCHKAAIEVDMEGTRAAAATFASFRPGHSADDLQSGRGVPEDFKRNPGVKPAETARSRSKSSTGSLMTFRPWQSRRSRSFRR